MLRALRRLGLGLGLLLAALAYPVAALVGALVPARTADVPARGAPVEVRLIRGPIHYDFLLPATPKLRAAFAPVAAAGVPVDDPRAAWIVVGWGGRASYTTVGDYTDLNARAVWRGATGDSAVMRVDVAGPLPDEVPSLRLSLPAARYDALLAGISASFEGGLAQARVLDTPGFGATDRFFAGTGRVNLFHTCNAWVGERLASAGVPVGAWTPMAEALSLSLRVQGSLQP